MVPWGLVSRAFRIAAFDGPAGEFGQVAQGAGLLDRVGLRLGPERFHLFLEEIDDVLGSLQPTGRRSRPAAQDTGQTIQENFHSPEAGFNHG